MCGNDKLTKARQTIKNLQANLVACNEHRLNLRHKQNKNGFRQMFSRGELDLIAIAAHNTHGEDGIGRIQEGWTTLITYGQLLQNCDREHLGRDNLGLVPTAQAVLH